MENNLYYTPIIEEFHVGFECEILGLVGAKEDEKLFSQPTIISQKELLLIDRLEIRVKYLDRSDIESLGWKYDVNMSELEYDSFYIEPGYDNKNRFIQYSLQNYKNGKVYLDKGINSGVHEIGFITIKNKSELIKLMQQLNIK